MSDKQTQALARLLKKMSALRVTLRKDERDLLDEIVLGAKAEVAGHKLSGAMSGRVAKAKRAEVAGHKLSAKVLKAKRADEAVTPRPTEVIAHRMAGAKTVSARMAGRADEAVTPRPTEVIAHRMAGAIRDSIEFDSTKKAYKVRTRAA